MASATTRPTFLFHFSHSSPPKTKYQSTTIPYLNSKFASISLSSKPILFTPHSIEISKEDKPTAEDGVSASPENLPEVEQEAEEDVFDKRRMEEKFAVLNTGIYECRSCGHKYDESVGDSAYPIPAGLPFEKLPEDWVCPTCGAAKSFFQSKSVEIAGFAQNQQFGLGGNTLTSGQKAVLIYGSLLFFFALFLSGYFLQ